MGIIYIAAATSSSAMPVTLGALKSTLWTNRRVIYTALGGVIPSGVAVLGYNLLRYNSLLPAAYIAEATQTAPDFDLKINHAFWIIFSPNGGLIIAWSASIITLLVFLKIAKLRVSRFGVIVSLSIIAFSVIFLANWWTPFGWSGWGNRLILPSMIAALITLASTAISSGEAQAERISSGARRKLRRIVVNLAALFLFGLSFSYLAISYSVDRAEYLIYSLKVSDACKTIEAVRRDRVAWEFVKSPVYRECHQDRFSYIPGTKSDISPLAAVDAKKYVIGESKGTALIAKGWSGIENWGVWSDGTTSEIRFIPNRKFTKIILELQPFLFGSLTSQRVKISLDGQQVNDAILNSKSLLEINLPHDMKYDPDRVNKLTLSFPDATAPADLGLSDDKRLLGAGLVSIEFQ